MKKWNMNNNDENNFGTLSPATSYEKSIDFSFSLAFFVL